MDRTANAINLLNIRSGRAVVNAPLRSQCARNYLYSPASDMRLEKLLQELEGAYANALRHFDDPGLPATSSVIADLRLFTFIQYLRTDQAMRSRKQAEADVYTMTFEGRMATHAPPPRHEAKTDREFMVATMRDGMLHVKYIADLKFCIIDNNTNLDFVTSDDPSVLTNRFLKQRHGHANFGLASSGVMFVLPLSPRRLFLLYDGNVYTIPDKENGRLKLRREASVRAFNELQFMKAGENIYFSDWNSRDRVAADLSAVSNHRRESWITVQVLVRDDRSDGREAYRVPRSEEERSEAREKLVHMASVFPTSTTWATEIKLRSPSRTYQNGSALGMVRKREWLTAEGRGDRPSTAGNRIYVE